jgi:hypothetical protein
VKLIDRLAQAVRLARARGDAMPKLTDLAPEPESNPEAELEIMHAAHVKRERKNAKRARDARR